MSFGLPFFPLPQFDIDLLVTYVVIIYFGCLIKESADKTQNQSDKDRTEMVECGQCFTYFYNVLMSFWLMTNNHTLVDISVQGGSFSTS